MIIRTFVGRNNYVWSKDPSLDRDNPAFNWPEFERTSSLEHAPAKEGCKLTVFEITPLSRKLFMRVFSMGASLDQMNEAIAYGLKGLRDYQSEGRPVELKTTKADGEERLTAETLDRLFEPMLWVELGKRILELSQLHP